MTPEKETTADECLRSIESIPSLLHARWWIILAKGSLVIAYGPYEYDYAVAIADECKRQEVPALVRAECGPKFDLEFVMSFKAVAAETKEDYV